MLNNLKKTYGNNLCVKDIVASFNSEEYTTLRTTAIDASNQMLLMHNDEIIMRLHYQLTRTPEILDHDTAKLFVGHFAVACELFSEFSASLDLEFAKQLEDDGCLLVLLTTLTKIQALLESSVNKSSN